MSDFQSLYGSGLNLSACLDILVSADKRPTIPGGPDKRLEIQVTGSSVGLLSQISDSAGNIVSSAML